MDECGFYPIDPQKLGSARKRFALPAIVHGNCRPMTEEDVDGVVELLQGTTGQFTFDLVWTPEVVRHWLLPRPGILYTYVIPSAKGPRALFSFYIMGWKTIGPSAKVQGDVRAAYIWYMASDGISIPSLIADLLNKAVNDARAEIANSLALNGIQEGLITNKFESGSKALEFYSYNFFVPPMDQSQMRFIFV
jgi:glycylpeptide N-tetradecanoyltransferase